MSILSLDHSRGRHSTRHAFGLSGFIAFVSRRWHDHRLMRSIESVPYDVMKDVGFPAAERANEI